jgi:hypothetical protein
MPGNTPNTSSIWDLCRILGPIHCAKLHIPSAQTRFGAHFLPQPNLKRSGGTRASNKEIWCLGTHPNQQVFGIFVGSLGHTPSGTNKAWGSCFAPTQLEKKWWDKGFQQGHLMPGNTPNTSSSWDLCRILGPIHCAKLHIPSVQTRFGAHFLPQPNLKRSGGTRASNKEV